MKTVKIVLKKERIDGKDGYTSFNSDDEKVVERINSIIKSNIDELSKHPSLSLKNTHFIDFFMDGSAKLESGYKFKFYDPDLKYMIGNLETQFTEIEFSRSEPNELIVNLKTSGGTSRDREAAYEILDILCSDEAPSLKSTAILNMVVSNIFHVNASKPPVDRWSY